MNHEQSPAETRAEDGSEVCEQDWSRSESASMAVVEAVAAVKGVDPVDLPPLYLDVDPDALDKLFPSRSRSIRRLTFQFRGTVVTVHGTGEVVARPAESANNQ